MKLPIVSKDNRGFTLVEVLVVIGIIGVLFTAGFFVSFDSYGRELLSSEESIFISVLSKARSRAMNNIHATNHGVHIEEDAFVIFRQFPYNKNRSTNERIERNKNIKISGGTDEIIFEQLSGNVLSGTGTLDLSDNSRVKNITIFSNGLIEW